MRENRVQRNKRMRKETIRKIIFTIALLVFITSLVKLFLIFNEYRKNSNTYDELRNYSPASGDIVQYVEDGENKTFKYTFRPEDYEKLLEINSEFKGWINIPGTKIDYPLAQADNNEYYLTHNFKKEENEGGAIFITKENSNPFVDRNTIIHGHYMKDGSMFGDLHQYKNEDTFINSNTIYISLRDEVLEYEIFSTYVEEASSDPYYISFSSDDDYVQYLNNLRDKSTFKKDVTFTKDDKIITLSTCSYETKNSRLLIHAKLKR